MTGLGTSPSTNDFQAFCAGIGDRDRGEQRLPARMARFFEQLAFVSNLNDAAEIHHGDAMAEMRDDREIMREQEMRDVLPALQVDQQIDDLGLDRDVECADRLVADDQAGPERKRPCNADPLALAAGKLMRTVPHVFGPQPHLLEQFCDPLPLVAACGEAEDAERFADDIAHGHPRIEGSERVLKHDLHRTAGRTGRAAACIGNLDERTPCGGRI